MKPCHKILPALLVAAGILHPQKPAPVCGLPHIAGLPPGEIRFLLKRSVLADTTFLIREHYTKSTLIEVEFYLMHDDSAFSIYAEAAEVDNENVDSSAVAELVVVFRDHTFESSIDPDHGIKAISEEVFGPPPDVDHNGKVYILLIDVRDDFVPDSSETYVAGYFDPVDQTQRGNLADVIYLDTNPGTISGPDARVAFGTLAHEYQHLIHYRWDREEETWVNEGLSELSPLLMGLPHRDFTPYLTDTNVRLDSFGGELADYARSGLFFFYTWVQLGIPFIQDLICSQEVGTLGFNATLYEHVQPPLDDFVLSWHLANFLQGEESYSYGGLVSIPQPVMHDVIISFPQDDFQRDVKRLGARWTLITGGSNLYMYVSRNGNEPGFTLIQGDSGTLMSAHQLFSTGMRDPTFGSDYNDLVVLVTSSSAVADSATYALYIDAEGGFEEITLAYDGDKGPNNEVPWIGLWDEDLPGIPGEAALYFQIANNEARLATVQFMAATSDSVTVQIYRQALTADNVLYTGAVRSPLGSAWTTHRIPGGLAPGNHQIYVSVSSSANALAYNKHWSESQSYYRRPGETFFRPLNTLKPVGSEEYLTGNWSIRLTYLIPDTSQGELKVPFIVGQFYPNPMAGVPLTRLDVSPGHPVELTLYNILGQEVRRLTPRANMPASLFWDGRMDNGLRAPSGVYLARVVSGTMVVKRKLVLIR